METKRVSIGCRVPANWVPIIDERAEALGLDRAGFIAAAIATAIDQDPPVGIDSRVGLLEKQVRAILSGLKSI